MSKLNEYRDDLLRWRGERKSLRDMEIMLMERGLDISATTIHKKLRQWGAPPTTLKGPQPDPDIVKRDAKIFDLVTKHGVDRRSIAERFGINLGYVRSILCNQKRARQ